MSASNQTVRLKELVMWQGYSTLRRVLFAPLIALVFFESLAQLPEIALTLALGVFSAPLLIAGVVTLDPLLLYVVALVWTSDLVYLAHFNHGLTLGGGESC